VFLVIAALGALLGLVYSGFSTSDFVEHLDRQLHGLNCSLLPGLTEPSTLDSSQEGCKTAMLSQYSSFWRDRHWGGVPWSLFAFGLFGFGLALSVWGVASRKGHRLAPSIVLLLTGVAAAGASIVFFSISMTKLHTLCATCAGTYISSALLLIGAGLAFATARSDRRAGTDGPESGKAVLIGLAVLLVEMGVACFAPVVVYLQKAPDFAKYVGSCETLKTTDGAQVLAMGAPAGPEAILVIDPLCPQCERFDARLKESPLAKTLSYKVFLLPLDAECNWMLKDSMHPGACMLSRALVCAGSSAPQMLEWIFANQEDLRKDGIGKQFDALKQKVLAKYPAVAGCIDSPDTTKKITDAMHRFAVENALPVVTPQFYVNGKRMCDEDTDLGLEYALAKLLGR
jgi:uncharacterized membrane protein/protein-disulfide isomerase